MEAAICAQFVDAGSEVAQVIPEIMTAEIKLHPQIERMKKQMAEEVQKHQAEFEKDMEQMKEDLRDREQELQKGIQKCVKQSDI